MKAVVLACLGTLLMTVGLGSGHGDLSRSNNELLDSRNQLARVRRGAGWERLYTVYRRQGTNLTLICGTPNTRIGVVSARYGMPTPTGARNCGWDVSAHVDDECFGKKTCTIPVTNEFFGGKPCPIFFGGRELKLTIRCWPEEATRVKIQMAIASENNDILLYCQGDTQIDVVSADYYFWRCRNDVTSTVDNLCFGNTTCKFAASNEVFGHHHCRGSVKTLLVTYRCWPKEAELGRLQSVHATEGDVRTLRCPANKYIEIISAFYASDACSSTVPDVIIRVDIQCRWKQTCRLPVTNDILGDTCRRKKKYLDLKYRCFPKEFLN